MFVLSDKDYNGRLSLNELKGFGKEFGKAENEEESEDFANFQIRLGDRNNDHQLNSEGVQKFFSYIQFLPVAYI